MAKSKILLVEDEKFIADIYARELGKAGLDVRIEGDGPAGLKALGEEKFDLLLLDIMLPTMNGLELLKKWKESHSNSSMPVILLTNLGQDKIIEEAFAMGAQGYLIKASYTPDQVVTEVKNVLKNPNAQPGAPS